MEKLTTKIENEFYNIFGLYEYAYLLKDTYYIYKTAFKDKELLVRLFKNYKNNRRFVVKKVEKQYFDITGEQWLKLICLHTIYTDLPFTSNTVKGLKNEIMKDLLEVYEDVYIQKELYADIRKVFNLKS